MKLRTLLYGFFASAALASAAFGADNLPAAAPVWPIKAPLASTPCTPVSCSGFYVGGTFGGAGTNLDILGSGLNNSLLAGGGIAGADVGYQYTTPNLFTGVEVLAGYQFATNATVNGVSGNQAGFLSYQIAKLGGNLSQLLGTTTAITVPPSLSNAQIGLYALTGAAERQFATGWASGAGVEFDVGPHSFIDVKYMHIQYGPTKNGLAQSSSEDIGLVSLNYKY